MSRNAKDKKLEELKKEIRSVLLSSPHGITVSQFIKDYKNSIGKSFPYLDFNYKNIPDFLKSMPDILSFRQGLKGMPDELIPVVSQKVGHINSMVANQKVTGKKGGMPSRRTISRQENWRNDISSNSCQSSSGSKDYPLNEETNISYSSFLSQSNVCSSEAKDQKRWSESDVHNDYSSATYNQEESDIAENVKTFIATVTNQFQRSTHLEGRGRGKKVNSNQTNCLTISTLPMVFEEKETAPMGIENNTGYSEEAGYFCKEDDYNYMYDEPSNHHFDDDFDPLSDEYLNRPPTPDNQFEIHPKMRQNIREILIENPGISSQKLCAIYKKKHPPCLDYAGLGFKDIKELILSIPDVVYHEQSPDLSDWILYDAERTGLECYKDAHKWIPSVVQQNMAKLAQEHPDGIKECLLLDLYKAKFNEMLCLKAFEIESVDVFIKSCTSVEYSEYDGCLVIFPRSDYNSPSSDPDVQLAIPSVNDMSWMWKNKFFENECDPTCRFKPFCILPLEQFNYSWVHVCDIINPNNLWLQWHQSKDELDKLMLSLNEFYNDNERHFVYDPSCIFEGAVCAVRFSGDGRWHRAQVLNIEANDTIKVQYVDYGTISYVDRTNLRKLHKEYFDLPVQSINASLHNLTYPPELKKWVKEAIDYAYALTYDKKFRVKVFNMDESIPRLDVLLYFLEDGATVNDLLLNAKLAVHVGIIPVTGNLAEGSGLIKEEESKSNFASPVSQEKELDSVKRVRTPPGYSSKYSKLSSSALVVSDTFLEEFWKLACSHGKSILMIEEKLAKFEEQIKSFSGLMREEIESMKVVHNEFLKYNDHFGSYAKNKENLTSQSPTEIEIPKEGNGSAYHHPMSPYIGTNQSSCPQQTTVGMASCGFGSGSVQRYPISGRHYPQNPQTLNSHGIQPPCQPIYHPPMSHPPESQYPPYYPEQYVMANNFVPGYQGVPLQMGNGNYPTAPFHSRSPVATNLYNMGNAWPIQYQISRPPVRHTLIPTNAPPQSTSHPSRPPEQLHPRIVNRQQKVHKADPIKVQDTNERDTVSQVNTVEGTESSLNDLEGQVLMANLNNCINEVGDAAASPSPPPIPLNIESSSNEMPLMKDGGDSEKLLNQLPSVDVEPENLESVVPAKKPVNCSMKIRVASSSVVHCIYLILLVSEKESPKIVVTLDQLLQINEKFVEPDSVESLPVVRITASDHCEVFEFLRNAGLYNGKAESVLVAQLEDVSTILEQLWGTEFPDDLTRVKEIFSDLMEVVTVEDEYWWTDNSIES